MSSENLIPKVDRKGKLVIVSGPSGVGKGTICKALVQRIGAVLSVSATTRKPGNGEVDGVNYWFMTMEDFEKKIQEHGFLEHAQVFGNLYGTPKDKVQAQLNDGQTVILEIDVQGAMQVKRVYPEAIMIFILPPSQDVLAKRMNHRGRDNGETDEIRLQQASAEIAAAWQYYDNMVINDDLETAINEVIQIIESK